MLGHAPLSAAPLSAFPAAGSAPVVPKITGYTRHRCGPVRAGCTVTLFRASDDIPVASTTSDGSGYYEFTNPVGAPFYAVAFNPAGLLAGVTQKNLSPA